LVCVSRTNIDIDDELVDRAMRMYRLESKRAAVQLALERLVGPAMTKDEVLAMAGTGYPLTNDELEADLDEADRPSPPAKGRRRRSGP
jgi:Arc/MetJ family transcription regulator